MNPMYEIPTGMTAVTPSDTEEIDKGYNGIWLEDAGDLAVQFKDGSTHVYGGLLKHTQLWGQYNKIFSTGTTATQIYLVKAGIWADGESAA